MKYRVYETWTATYIVEADSEEQAETTTSAMEDDVGADWDFVGVSCEQVETVAT